MLLAAPDEEALLALQSRANDAGITMSSYHEPDFGDALTAIALAPSDETRRLCANLPLALKEAALV